MGATLEGLMHTVSQSFLTPVLIAISVLFAYALFALGAFAWQAVQRRRGQLAGFELRHARHLAPDLTEVDLEVLAARRLEPARLTSRVAPMLGLVATMIPMGPALQALGDGNLADVSRSLSVAFSAVILSLIAASLTHGVVQVRRRWYLAEIATLDAEAEA
ncbi:MAG: MotA/TolQ/ExbB proton channel family protein [Rhodocyclaceae bacterium]|nr:MotA/TolQ/ExbB proton channel family protein [Rhodocyclaceae bacterium]MCB1958875.1 MotA/TolQ/ExbB proton channel family protein [Rhodocyclaceae bacterium]